MTQRRELTATPFPVSKSLVAIRMNERFTCLAFMVKSLNCLLGNRDKDKHNFCERKPRR